MATIKIARIFDKYNLSLFCLIIGGFKKILPKKKSFKKNKILIVKLWAIGDSVLLLPAIDEIKKKFPNSKISVLAHKRNKEVFSGQKSIDEIIDFGIVNIFKNFRKFDVVIDAEPYLNVSALISFYCGKYTIGFSHGKRSSVYDEKILFDKNMHVANNYMNMTKSFGIQTKIVKLSKLNYSKKDSEKVSMLLKKEGIKSGDFVIGICPGVAESVKSRMWPKENFIKLSDELIEKINAKIIIIDSNSNKNIADEIVRDMKNQSINLSGKVSLKELFCLVERCNVFISNDTGSMHIAAAQGVKTVGLFGPNTPKLWAPFGKENVSLYHPPYCSPCIDNSKGFMPECFNKVYQKCMKDISVKEVFESVKRLR